MMPKILYVATVVKTHIMEFHIPYLKMLKDMGWETAVAARNDYENPQECNIPYCDTFFDIPFERQPFKSGNIKAYKRLKRIIDNGNYDIIHCHTPVGAMITRLAAREARKRGTKVFYTAHGFHFYKGAPLLNWILYYPVEKWLSHMTDVLITITHEDYERANRKFKSVKVEYVPGVGIDIKRFGKGSPERSVELRSELGIPDSATVLLSVGEVNANKNHKVVIQVLPYFPNMYFVICGQGSLINEHRELAEELGVSNRVIMTGYRNDVVDFYNMANVFVFPSFREGLPVALMEAIASGLICVASRNRGSDDLIIDKDLLFDPKNVDDLKDKLKLALNRDWDENVRHNKEHLLQFDLSNTLELMQSFYNEKLV